MSQFTRVCVFRVKTRNTWIVKQNQERFNGLNWSLLVKHLVIEDVHNSWLSCFTNPLEFGTRVSLSHRIQEDLWNNITKSCVYLQNQELLLPGVISDMFHKKVTNLLNNNSHELMVLLLNEMLRFIPTDLHPLCISRNRFLIAITLLDTRQEFLTCGANCDKSPSGVIVDINKTTLGKGNDPVTPNEIMRIFKGVSGNL